MSSATVPKPWRRGLGLLLPVALLLAWQLVSQRGPQWALAFPPLVDIGRSAVDLLSSGVLPLHWLATLKTATTGLLIGSTAGVIVGAAMGSSVIADRLIGPLYHSIRQVPLLGWIPLIGLWFGHGVLSKTLIVCLAAFYPLVLNTCEGIRNVERRHLELGRVLGLTAAQRLRLILIPEAMPAIFTGLSHALAFAWISTVGSELLFTAGPGLGGLMQIAQNGSRMDVIVLCVVSIALTGYAANLGLGALRSHVLRWRPVR